MPGGCLAPDSAHATIQNPEWFVFIAGRYRPRSVRAELHRRLREEVVARSPGVQQGRRAIILAGPPGAGKSTIIAKEFGTAVEDYLRIDADEFKVSLLEQAKRDGSFDSFLFPHALRMSADLFFPLELASLVHEESSMLAKALRQEAIGRGDNIIIDGVLSEAEKALALGEELADAGYAIEVVDVEVPYALSKQRVVQRWRKSYEAALEGGGGLGGRWVPSEYARSVFDGSEGASKCEHASLRLARECGAVVRYRLFRTTLDHRGRINGPFLEQSIEVVTEDENDRGTGDPDCPEPG
jgi:chloramphenicol 3-O-phosphotransferase